MALNLKSLILEILVEALFGQKFPLTLHQNGTSKVLKAVTSANTRFGEKPYRITWFDDELKNHHIDMDAAELVNVMGSGEFPPEVVQRIRTKWPNGHLVGDKYTFDPLVINVPSLKPSVPSVS